MAIPKNPICAVCNKEVDSFDINDFGDTRTTEYVAKCHGEEEKIIVSWTERGNIVGWDKAFNTKRLTNEISNNRK